MIQPERYTYWDDKIPGRPSDLNFVKQVDLPVSDFDKKATVQVRTFPLANDKPWAVIHPTVPNRNEVWRQNYTRRTEQLRQGFNSRIDKPYVGLWDPVYLDSKKLLTTRLGLPEEVDTYLVSAEDMKNVDNIVAKASGPTKYVPKRSKKDLNNLKNEISHGRKLIRSVKLGHNLFNLLQSEYQAMKNRKEMEAERQRQMARETWQGPKALCGAVPGAESDSDDEEEVDLSQFMVDVKDRIVPVEDFARDVSIRPESQATGYPSETARNQQEPSTSTPRAKSAPVKKKRGIPRPYTPKETNISLKAKHQDEFEWQSLFSQLCALYWILEAMDIPETSMMTPILECWEIHKPIGGEEIKNKKELETQKKKHEQEYENLVRPPKAKPMIKRKMSERKQESRWNRYKPRANSLTASVVSSTPYGSQADLDFDRPEMEHQLSTMEEMYERENELEPASSKEDQTDSKEQSPRSPAHGSKRLSLANEDQGGPRHSYQDLETKQDKEWRRKLAVEKRQLEVAKQLDEIAKWEDQPIERLSSYKQYRVGTYVAPRPTKEIFDFKSNCQSAKKQTITKDAKMKWAEVQSESSIRLHDSLEYHLRQRLKTCKSKFLVLNPSGSSFHRTMSAMRQRSEMIKQEEAERLTKAVDKSKYAKWYHYLCDLVPAELTKHWQIAEILEKLQKFGLRFSDDDQTEAFRQNSERKFVKVLSDLRPWELCSPDIAAAIEFCREHILEMSVDDFEEFLHLVFPAIDRPKTAPPKIQK